MKLIKGVLFMEYADLVDTYGIGRSTIDAGVNKHSKGISPSWASMKDPEDKRKRLIVYSTIPAHSKKRMPSEQELIRLYHNQEAERKKIGQLLKKGK
ncbi:hypothetical protein [Pontibacter flavimaris]|uniref:Uncharacterized protein n=1 Tax=Pontibacter flavimaris TaxID=1797110 RepID=A0A1Q5PDL5_9BACT|nr:hypothetical protein [Pontibacter flavimaris]OKL40273.1 hypothetical protein A3841_18280 [Pontibacter flavimaris]